jgi:S1-C subfamily serine protease
MIGSYIETLEKRNPDLQKLSTNIMLSTVVVNVTTIDPEQERMATAAGQTGSGTGFFVKVDDEHAWIVTNHHVVESYMVFPMHLKIDVLAANRPWIYEAQLVGSDPLSDIAVIKIKKKDMETKWKALEWADEDSYLEGEPVLTVGHGLNLQWTVSTGIVSSLDRIQFQPLQFMIQHDAVINQGNSGGPLVNYSGKVIGVNSMILSPTIVMGPMKKGWDGIALAVNGWQAERAVNSILETGKVEYPRFDGFKVEVPTIEEAQNVQKQMGAKHRSYAKMVQVDETKQAYKNGMREGDIMVQVNGKDVWGLLHFIKACMHHNPGDVIKITLLRGEELITIDYTLLLFPEDEPRVDNRIRVIPAP